MAVDDGEDIEIIDFSTLEPLVKQISLKTKKPKKSKLELAAKVFNAPDAPTQTKNNRINLNEVDGHDAFSYGELLKIVQDELKAKNAGAEAKTRFKMENPVTSRTRTKSTWHNFDGLATKIGRKPQHVLDFITSELGCDGNIGSSGEMILTGAFGVKQFTNLMNKYFKEFVEC